MQIHNCQLRFLMAIIMLSTPLASNSQHTSAVKAHTFRVIGGLYTVGVEHALSEHLSAEVSLQGGDYIDFRPNRSEEYQARGIGGIGAIRYYPFTRKTSAPGGFFGYAALRYVGFEETYHYIASGDRYEVGGNIINAGLGIGYKFVYRRVGLEAFVGWGAGRLKSDDAEYRNRIPKVFQSSIEEQAHFPQLDVALCYMFTAIQKR